MERPGRPSEEGEQGAWGRGGQEGLEVLPHSPRSGAPAPPPGPEQHHAAQVPPADGHVPPAPATGPGHPPIKAASAGGPEATRAEEPRAPHPEARLRGPGSQQVADMPSVSRGAPQKGTNSTQSTDRTHRTRRAVAAQEHTPFLRELSLVETREVGAIWFIWYSYHFPELSPGLLLTRRRFYLTCEPRSRVQHHEAAPRALGGFHGAPGKT